MKHPLLCFSYGSNMSLARLQARAPSARFLTTATLPEHRLTFHKRGRDGSSKCDALHTGLGDDRMFGVVFEISPVDKSALDRIEGLGAGYDEKRVDVLSSDGETLRPVLYYATDIDERGRPFHWYKEHVLVGARENGLPREYIRLIEETESIADPDRNRHRLELAIYPPVAL